MAHAHWDSTWQLRLKAYITVCVCVCVCVFYLFKKSEARGLWFVCPNSVFLLLSPQLLCLLEYVCITEVSSHAVILIHTTLLSHCALLYHCLSYCLKGHLPNWHFSTCSPIRFTPYQIRKMIYKRKRLQFVHQFLCWRKCSSEKKR